MATQTRKVHGFSQHYALKMSWKSRKRLSLR
jgi:hypothetical protein